MNSFCISQDITTTLMRGNVLEMAVFWRGNKKPAKWQVWCVSDYLNGGGVMALRRTLWVKPVGIGCAGLFPIPG
jgi:hypothetical protein